MEKAYKNFGYCGLGVMTESGLITPNSNQCTPYLNSSSRIIDVVFDTEKEQFVLSYFKSTFDDEVDKYSFYYIPEKDLTKGLAEELVGYTFYGRFYVDSRNEYRLVFGRLVDKIRVD